MHAALTRLMAVRRRMLAMRLQVAEQELDFMRHHAPAALARQQREVSALRARVDGRCSEQVRRDVEQLAKAGLLAG